MGSHEGDFDTLGSIVPADEAVPVLEVPSDVPAAEESAEVADVAAPAEAVDAEQAPDEVTPPTPDEWEGRTRHPGLDADGTVVCIEQSTAGNTRTAGPWLPEYEQTSPPPVEPTEFHDIVVPEDAPEAD